MCKEHASQAEGTLIVKGGSPSRPHKPCMCTDCRLSRGLRERQLEDDAIIVEYSGGNAADVGALIAQAPTLLKQRDMLLEALEACATAIADAHDMRHLPIPTEQEANALEQARMAIDEVRNAE